MKIPNRIVKEIIKITDKFNLKTYKNTEAKFIPRVKGQFLYLDRIEFGQIESILRLRYTGDMKECEFAIYKYSTESYDDEEIFIPGSEYIDGTIEGTLKAGSLAYPL